MIPLSLNTLPLIGGLLILLLNVVVSAFRLWRKHLRATVINVVLTVIACVLLAIGVTRISFAASAAGVDSGSPADVSSLAGGVPASTLPILLTAMGAIMLTGAGLLLFLNERNRAGFEPSYSPGLLYIGAGIFGLAATLFIPAIPGTPTPARAAAISVVTSTGPVPTRVVAQLATASYTPTPRPSPTEVPSLTPAPSDTPILLVTPITFISTGVSTASTGCNVVAQTTLNMRGDPSVQNRGMGSVFAGSLLPVTGQSADKKWWRVINNDGVAPVEGWVSSQFVTLNSACNVDAVPVVSDSGTSLTTPTLTQTPTLAAQTPQATSQAAATSAATIGTQAADAGIAGTPVTCMLITTTAVSVRGDPSRMNVPIGQISQNVAVKAIGKTANAQWWHVIFTADGQDGWIGAGVVLVPTSCAAVPSITLTPAP